MFDFILTQRQCDICDGISSNKCAFQVTGSNFAVLFHLLFLPESHGFACSPKIAISIASIHHTFCEQKIGMCDYNKERTKPIGLNI